MRVNGYSLKVTKGVSEENLINTFLERVVACDEGLSGASMEESQLWVEDGNGRSLLRVAGFGTQLAHDCIGCVRRNRYPAAAFLA